MIAANGRAFLSTGHEAQDSFCLHLDGDTVALLIETDPNSFYQTPHYAFYGAVLVRYDAPDRGRVAETIARSHAQVAALPRTKPRRR